MTIWAGEPGAGHMLQDCRFLTHPAVNPFMSMKKDVALTDLKYIINRCYAM